jgi:RHS repeat-associated protein
MRLLACIVLSATAQASNYRFGAGQDRVVSDEDHGYTQHITPDFEVQDGIAVTYVRLGKARVARLVATDYAAKVYTDVAPLDGADGKITAGDAWIAQQAMSGAVSLTVTPTAVDRLLLSGARRILYETVPTTVYFAHDQLGSLTDETDDQGAVIGQRAYSTWGGERAASGDGDSYGFTGQRQDDSGTVHFSFRQLDPATGRWSSTDPLFHVATPDRLNAFGEATTSYAYVANNPSNLVDPTGLETFLSTSSAKPKAKTSWSARRQEKKLKSRFAKLQYRGLGEGTLSLQAKFRESGSQLLQDYAQIALGYRTGETEETIHSRFAQDVKHNLNLRVQASAFLNEDSHVIFTHGLPKATFTENEAMAGTIARDYKQLRTLAYASFDLVGIFSEHVRQ